MKNPFRKEKPNEWLDKVVEEVKREKVPTKIQYEIVRQKDNRTVVVKKGKIAPKREWVQTRIEGVRRRYYPNHIIKEEANGKVRYFVRWNAYFSEAYDVKGEIAYDVALENALMDDMEGQLGKAVGQAVGFVLEKPIIMLLVLAMVFGIPIGLSFNNIFNWVPQTVVHWVPRA